MEKYLYGASVQGIQSFIFQTSKLKEIVGASELVERICTDFFDEFAKNGESIVRAAGKVIFAFNDKKECELAVKLFPRKVMMIAPGITISQAVVKYSDNYVLASNELEAKLRIQRNKPARSLTMGLMSVSRAPSTGLPAVKSLKGVLVDDASVKKTDSTQTTKGLMMKLTDDAALKHDDIAYDFKDLEGHNSWIAVIHADGNGIGNIVQQVCKNSNDAKLFSNLLNNITIESARDAYKKAIEKNKKRKIPVRPVVLGGDDLTIICRADLAIAFIQRYLEAFESESKKQLKQLGKYEIVSKGLTACAGIAFVKSSYPFHYAINLAENLCVEAKKEAKKIDSDLAPSCFSFHKVQDSFVESYDVIALRELTPNLNLSFKCGPYYIHEQEVDGCETASQLLSDISRLESKEGNALKSHLRQWLSLLFDDIGAANQKMKRIRTVNKLALQVIPECYEKISGDSQCKIPYYNILSLASILLQRTKDGGNVE